MTLVGVGLLGGSLGLAARRRMLADEVVGYVRRPESVRECERAGAVDHATLDLKEAVSGADLVVFCTPLGQMLPLARKMLPALRKGALVTDVGSVKGAVIRDLEKRLARHGAHFVGSHPMAGSERTGVAAARADLFAGAVCVVTPTANSHKPAVRKVEHLWKRVGGRLLRLSPEAHDQLVSRSSHLPYVVAAALASFVLDSGHPKEQHLLCANGFRDSTRIASGSPEMWRDIALTNRRHLARALASFIRDLEKCRQLLARGDSKLIESFLVRSKARRDRWRELAVPRSAE